MEYVEHYLKSISHFFDATGNIDIDGDAVDELRKESMRFDDRRDYPALHKDEKEKRSEE